MLQLNRDICCIMASRCQWALFFYIYSIKTPVGGNQLVAKALGWSGFAHLSLFPVTQAICYSVC